MNLLRDLLEERFRVAADAHASGAPDLPIRLAELRQAVLLAIDRAPLELMRLTAEYPEVARLLPLGRTPARDPL